MSGHTCPFCENWWEDEEEEALDVDRLARAINTHQSDDGKGYPHACFADCAEEIAFHYGDTPDASRESGRAYVVPDHQPIWEHDYDGNLLRVRCSVDSWVGSSDGEFEQHRRDALAAVVDAG